VKRHFIFIKETVENLLRRKETGDTPVREPEAPAETPAAGKPETPAVTLTAKNTVARRGPVDSGYPRGWGPLTRPPFSKEMFPEGGYA
jgi:hypothetical protein